MADLERCLRGGRADGARFKLVFSDGVFSMDGTIAQLDGMRALCDRYGALLGIDECHATGFMGARGRGTHEHRGVFGKVDIITGTLGKALGGASGGFTAARREVVELLRQRSRPYLFSNTLMPAIVGASIAVLDLLEASTALRDKLEDNTRWFREAIATAGFDIKPGEHPIVPIMVYDAVKAQQLARAPARARRLRRRLLLPGGAQGPGAHPRADERGARARAARSGGRGLHAGRARARAHGAHDRDRRSSSSAPTARSAPSWPRTGASAMAPTPSSPATSRRRAACPGSRTRRSTCTDIGALTEHRRAPCASRRSTTWPRRCRRTGEKHPMWAWDLNMKGLLNVLKLARSHKLERIFWPSSIAAFGPSTPQDHTPQTTVMDPSTVYGISKLAGERWCAWYHRQARRRRAQPALPRPDQLEDAARRRHHRLRGRDLPRRAEGRALHLLPARRPGAADDVHARRDPRHASS